MDTALHAPAADCAWTICTEPREGESREPYQLSFLSPIAGGTVGTEESPYENDPEYIRCMRRLRRRRCKSLKAADVA